MSSLENMKIRAADFEDLDAIRDLITLSVHGLQAGEYSQSQRDAALGSVFGTDRNLIKDKTYFVIELDEKMIACGGWSFRKALFGADSLTSKEPELLNPEIDAARVRAFFIHPDFARMGIGKILLEHCENAARAGGFKTAELGATLTGVPFYAKYGYVAQKEIDAPLPNGETLGIVQMGKAL